MDAAVVQSYLERQNFSLSQIIAKETIQRLWGGYGEIVRYKLEGEQDQQRKTLSIIVKNVQPPKLKNEDIDVGHARKLRSYQVETCFYVDYSQTLLAHKGDDDSNNVTTDPRIPRLLSNQSSIDKEDDFTVQLLLEDLDAAGFPKRQGYGSAAYLDEEVKPMVQWLARFHGAFLVRKTSDDAPTLDYFPGLWEQGCYWHLDTRPDEFKYMDNRHPLKKAAKMLDCRLKHHSHFVTLLHGDAKVCNFCFSKPSSVEQIRKVAAVDFQYCGGGVGLRDVAYLLHSCCDDEDLKSNADDLLDYYFEQLFEVKHVTGLLSDQERKLLEKEWRELWPTCFADFERFLMGWSPGHSSYGYSKQMIQKALNQSLDVDNTV